MCGSWGHLQPGQGDSLKTGTRSLWKLGPIEAVRSTAEDSGKNIYAVNQVGTNVCKVAKPTIKYAKYF